MKKKQVVYTPQSREGLRECMSFLKKEVPSEKVKSIRKELLDKVEILKEYPHTGQEEELLSFLDQGHRRLVYRHYKVIYLIESERVIVTDIFDSRQDPEKMKG